MHMCTQAYDHAHMGTHNTHTGLLAYMQGYTHMCAHTYMNTVLPVCTYARTTHTCAHTHTQAC